MRNVSKRVSTTIYNQRKPKVSLLLFYWTLFFVAASIQRYLICVCVCAEIRRACICVCVGWVAMENRSHFSTLYAKLGLVLSWFLARAANFLSLPGVHIKHPPLLGSIIRYLCRLRLARGAKLFEKLRMDPGRCNCWCWTGPFDYRTNIYICVCVVLHFFLVMYLANIQRNKVCVHGEAAWWVLLFPNIFALLLISKRFKCFFLDTSNVGKPCIW